MKRRWLPFLLFRIPVGEIRIGLDLSWIAILPGGVWAIAALYVPIFGGFLNASGTWAVAVLAAALAAGSLAGHLAAHRLVAHWTHNATPKTIPLLLFGDAAQAWPAAQTALDEAFIAAAGPLFNLVVAGLAYLVWNAQLTPYLNVSMPFVAFFNLWLGIVNLAPVFPLDGGRLARAILWGQWGRPDLAARMGIQPGLWAVVVMTGWGIFLIQQRDRFSLQIGILTIVMDLLFLIGLVTVRTWKWDRPVEARAESRYPALRAASSGLTILALLAVAFSLAMTNNGLETPGVALSVEPMVTVPAAYRHPVAGTFLLTSVVETSPVPVAGWVAGQLVPSFRLLPPERPAENLPSPQQSAIQGFQMLDQSETTAAAVGMQLAGYPAQIVGKGVQVVSILPGSPSQGVLQPGDVITGMDGQPVRTTNDLIAQVKAQDPQANVHLQVERNGQTQTVSVGLMPPAAAGGAPKVGITIDSAGVDYQLPFPVTIVPQKIVGGPSAGLMFTLTVYNLLTPGDLTHGLRIAGTGTISADGTVGPIGGVEMKVIAAEIAGARYFLSPPDNYAAARAAAHHIQVVEVATAQQAIAFLKGLPAQAQTAP